MRSKNSNETKSSYPRSVRILALIMSVLVASGVVTLLISLIMKLFT